MTLLDLPRVELAGSPAAMGAAYGEALRTPIRGFVAERLRAARAYLRERGIRDLDAFVDLGRRCLDRLAAWDPDGHAEHLATAAAAGVDAAQLYTAGNMTDVRDILALPGARADAEGCTAVLVPPARSADGALIAAQTWDLNPGDIDFVVAVHRRPAEGPETWSVTCAGCPSLIGMNGEGIAVGTTNIKTRGSRVGIPYLSLLHRAIRCRDRAAAVAAIAEAPRAAAHVYWLADAAGASELECSAERVARRELAAEPLVHTNHCLDAANAAIEGEPASSSSRARLARMRALAGAGAQDVATLRRHFADRGDGVDSINRWPEDAQGTATDACIVAVPARRELWACRGPADRGAWVRLPFAR